MKGMGAWKGPRKVVLPTSHWRPSMNVAGTGRMHASDPPPRLPRTKAADVRRAERKVEDLIATAVRKWKAPRDGVIRAIASAAAKGRRSWPRIAHFDRVVKTYASLQLRYRDRYVVEEWVYVRMKQLLEETRQEWRKRLEKIARRSPPSVMERTIAFDAPTFADKDLERLADRVFAEVAAHVFAIAETGRPVRRSSPRGYVAKRGVLGQGSSSCFVILDVSDGAEPVVVGFKTAGKFNRAFRRRFNRRERESRFTNRPPMLRH